MCKNIHWFESTRLVTSHNVHRKTNSKNAMNIFCHKKFSERFQRALKKIQHTVVKVENINDSLQQLMWLTGRSSFNPSTPLHYPISNFPVVNSYNFLYHALTAILICLTNRIYSLKSISTTVLPWKEEYLVLLLNYGDFSFTSNLYVNLSHIYDGEYWITLSMFPQGHLG